MLEKKKPVLIRGICQDRCFQWRLGLRCGLFVGITGSNAAGGHGCLSRVSVVCCQVEVSATG